MADWPSWEVFLRPRAGLAHQHVGAVHAPDAAMALHLARDLYTRRSEGISLWVAPGQAVVPLDPDTAGTGRDAPAAAPGVAP